MNSPRTTVRDNDAPESDGPDGRPGLRVRGRLRPCRNHCAEAYYPNPTDGNNPSVVGNEARNTGSNREATGNPGEATRSTEATGKGTTGTTEVA